MTNEEGQEYYNETMPMKIITKHCVMCGKEGHHWNECANFSVHDELHKAFGVKPIIGYELPEEKP